MVHQHTTRSKVDTFLVNIDSNCVKIRNLYGQVSIADSAPSGVNRQAIDNQDKKVKDCLKEKHLDCQKYRHHPVYSSYYTVYGVIRNTESSIKER